MNLTERAQAYLKTLNRDADWITDQSETESYLSRMNLRNPQAILNAQLNFSGYHLTIHENEKHSYEINFISKFHVAKNKKVYSEMVDDEMIVDFENSEKTYHYFITEKGYICTKDEESPGKFIIPLTR